MTEPAEPHRTLPRWLVFFLIFGLYLSLRGYQSREGDQAYRLPLLLHQQNHALFADDPFVRAFDNFNPHRGYLALLDAASRPFGLSTGIFVLYALTFAGMCLGIGGLARAAWPELGERVGFVAVALLLVAKAGNIATMHLFEPILLDRLIGFTLGWCAFAEAVRAPGRGWWTGALAIAAAALIHPSVGILLALLLSGTWVCWAAWPTSTRVDWRVALKGILALGLALVPAVAMNVGQGGRLLVGLPPAEFRLLSFEVQNPQHMLPHLWRLPQWLAWGCYPVLALVAFTRRGNVAQDAPVEGTCGRLRLAILLGVNLAGVAAAWVAVEVFQDLRVTLFQPFRVATIARGLALVALSGRILTLWRQKDALGRARALLLTVGLVGDWSLVVATLTDLVWTGLEVLTPAIARFAGRGDWVPRLRRLSVIGAAVTLGWGLWFLSRHDTQAGHVPLVCAVLVGGAAGLVRVRGNFQWNRRRVAFATLLAWYVPMASVVASAGPWRDARWAQALVERCRFSGVATDDVERLAVWCREHTPPSARFIGPPGPKTFRLWSERSLAFNRAASPYDARGLADWSARYRDHVGFAGDTAAFARAYQGDRHGLEKRYQEMSSAERAALAVRQGASYVVAAAPAGSSESVGPLEWLHTEGRYAVYRLREDRVVGGLPSAGRRH